MSKGKELLVHALDRLKHINFEDDHLTNDLIQTIQKYLAQPEQPEPEPVAWIDAKNLKSLQESTGYALRFLTNDTENLNVDDVPLYLAPPKRERITDEEIYNHCCAMDNSYTCNFIDGVEWAEHQHGIRSFDE